MNKNIARRLAKLRTQVRRLKLDAIVITNQTNVRYLSGFTGDSSAILVTQSETVFVTDFRYIEQAGEECTGYRVVKRNGGTFKTLARQAKKLGAGKVGIEANVLSLNAAEQFRAALGKIEMVNTHGVVGRLREIKDRDEITAIEACIRANEKCLEHIRSFLVPGIRELDISAEIEYFARGLGFDGMAFPTIAAFGPRGSLPHARPTKRRLRKGDPVLIDCGVTGDGYVSDLTRVFFHNKISARFERIYRIVLEAQRRAIRRIRPGVKAGVVGRAARGHITKAGFGPRFGHGLGHGIGMQVHEAPGVSAGSGTVLRRGMVFTVEPGIYIPGFGGVRIEDNVLVTPKGVRVLSDSPKELKDIIIGG